MNPWNALVGLLGRILSFFYDLIPSYGIAIILLTLLISFLLFPLTLKQTRSMKAMQEIQPEVKRIQKEYRGNREEMNKQMMALYQERGVNPAAGCLPLLVQMPIWFALFSVLRINTGDPTKPLSTHIPENSDLYGALERGATNFLGMDMLSSPSSAFTAGLVDALPYIILILIVVASSYYQTYQTTRRRTQDPQQPQQGAAQGMQTAMKIMPLFFGFISWTFPAGLVLYFAVSNMFRVGQQAVILRMDDADSSDSGKLDSGGNDKGDRGDSASAEDGSTDETPRSGPSPHASKKRKKRRRK